MVEVRRHQLFVHHVQDALQRADGGALDGVVDFLNRGGALGDELQVHQRHVGGGHAHRHAVQLAFQLRQHQAHGLGGAGGGGDHAQRRGAGAVEILVHGVQRRLVAGIGMDGGHHALFDAHRIVQHLGHRHQAVGGAGGVGDDGVFPGQLVVIDAIDHGQVGILAGGADQHALGAGVQVQSRLFAGGEQAGAFQRDIHTQFLVRQFGGVLDGGDLDPVAGGDDVIAIHAHLRRETAMHAVIAQQMGVGFDRPQVIDGHHLDVAAPRFHDRPQHKTADAAEAVDCNAGSHGQFSS